MKKTQSARNIASAEESLKTLLRPFWIRIRYLLHRILSCFPISNDVNLTYILGCGRSGTTIIGKTIGSDSEVLYLNEPYYIWQNISPATDFSGLFRTGGQSWLGEADSSVAQSTKLKRILSALAAITKRIHVVEKTPINTLRIEWLRAVSPRARFVVVKRDWVEVVNSIIELASNDPYRVGADDYNAWWGRGNYKVRSILLRDPFRLSSPEFRGFIGRKLEEGETRLLNLNMAVYEALASHIAIEKDIRDKLVEGKHYLEIDYDRFVIAPSLEISRVVSWIKNGQAPILDENQFDGISRRNKELRYSRDDILSEIHPDLRAKVEAALSFS